MTMPTLHEVRDTIRTKKITASQWVERTLRAIDALEPRIGALLHWDAERARQQARAVDQKIADGRAVGELAGVPLFIKDNLCTTWGTTSCASKILADFRAPYDAHVVEKLADADAILIGKTNLDEFAMGSSTENSAVKPTRNPWDLDRVPGGSSGGSAAAVASGMVSAAIGSDTGGSIRQPASFCGITGLKPTYGRVSRYGLVAYGSSLDQVGPFAQDVRDAALLLKILAGHDPRDSTCLDIPVPDYPALLDEPGRALKIGVAEEYFGQGLDGQVRSAVQDAIDVYRGANTTIVPIHLPHMRYAVACFYVIVTAEASSNLSRYDGVHYGHRTDKPTDYQDVYSASRQEGFGAEVRRRIMLGTFALSSGYLDAYYLKALKVRTLIKQDFDRAFEEVDVIACPVSPVPAWALGERIDDPLSMYLLDVYTASANLSGVPAISIPCGMTSEGLPVGLQLMAPPFAEDRLLRVAHAFQKRTDWHTRRPTVVFEEAT